MSSSKVVQLGIEKRAPAAEPVLAHVHALAHEFLGRLLCHMLDNADDTLFAMADKAQSDRRQNDYFDAMRALRIVRGDIENGFARTSEGQVEAFLDGTSTATAAPKPDEEAGLSLVDETDLETSLAVTGMIDKAKCRLSHQLYGIEQRYRALLGRPCLTIDEIPIGPRPICQAFDAPVGALNVEIEIKLIIYKLFDRDVLGHLGLLYDKVNDRFIAEGVLPVLRMAKPSQRQDAIESPAHPLTDEALTAAVSGRSNGDEASTSSLAALRKLLQPQSIEADIAAAQAISMADNVMLLQVIAGLQRLDMASSAVILEQKIADLRTRGQLRQVDEDVINIVEMLFEFILEDDAIPSIVRAQIGRLQIPMIRLALIDPSLFEDRRHPARRLINHMAHAAVGLTDGNETQAPIIDRITAIVDRICNHFDDEHQGIFAELLEDLDAFLEQQENGAINDAERLRLEQRDRHAAATTKVDATLARIIDGQILPRPVFEILDGPWKAVMMQAYLDDGDQGQAWQQSLQFVERLLESIVPPAEGSDLHRLAKIVPDIVSTLRMGLAGIGYPEDQTQALLEGLESVHLAALCGQRQGPIDGVQVRAAEHTRPAIDMADVLAELDDIDIFADTEGADETAVNSGGYEKDTATLMRELFGGEIEEIVLSTTANPIEAEIEDEAWQTVLALEPGKWLSLAAADGKPQRAKLVWKSDLAGECAFMNWHGRITAEIGFNELAARLRTGEAKIIDDLPLFERAVDAVMQTLQRRNR